MTGRKTILVTGFSGFPGVPVNPTERLIKDLARRFPRSSSNAFVFAVLTPAWDAREMTTRMIAEEVKADAVVHFGVDGKGRTIRIETRAANRATRCRPDTAGQRFASACLDPKGPKSRSSTLSVRRLAAAARRSGAAVELSRDAGTYLCNATLWDTLGLGIPAVFVHVPALPRGRNDPRPGYPRIEAATIHILRETDRILRS
ncbi:pyrrolidone-carboxylate peptidase [Roseibium aquae]|uniref:Pyrrolidone-carboxylate peptidase n=1 Tax=Roseibium aquae TaxID=1323746 RepID=A0A916TKT4_9HYPH|nr:peptidase C15 [Roseibium aquae]GGB50269.1 pyrrolidone-carboxylate peptidase [Roseibium aquae]